MKVICVNNKPMMNPDGYLGFAHELQEGESYTVKSSLTIRGLFGYLLVEVRSPRTINGSFRADRFIPLFEIDETEMVREQQTVNA